jgi:lysyl oxidase
VKQSHRHAMKRLAPATALIVATGLSAAGLASNSFAADTSAPTLKLVSSTKQQVVKRTKGEPVYLYDLGIHAIAEKASFEIRTQRGTGYRDPIKATLTRDNGTEKTTTTLPSELFKDVQDLKKFFGYSVTNKAGKVVKRGELGFCPNSWAATRAVIDGAPTSPYPRGCDIHPFGKGNVLGIQRGWTVPALGNWENPPSFKGADGNYTVRVLILAPWRKALGLTKAQGDASITAKVKTVAADDGEAVRPGSATASSHQHGTSSAMAGMHMNASADGTLSPQHAKMEAIRKLSLGKAAKPHTAPPAKGARAADVSSMPKPDLQSVPAYQIQLSKVKKKTYVNFGATVWNAGPSPLVVDGFRINGNKDMDAYQYFYDSAGKEVGNTPAGGLQWDPRKGHEHWHFKAFASYRLLNSTKTVTERSGKEAFCLAPTDAVNLNSPGANWDPMSTDLSSACGEEGALSIREALDVGWGDTYTQGLPGQSFNVTNLKNGVYFIEVLANPDHKLAESNTKNNTALRKIKLGGTVGGKRTIKVYDYAGLKVP